MSLIYLQSRQRVNTHYYRAQESWTWRRRTLDPVNGISKKEYVDFHSLSLYFLLIFIPFLCSKGRWCQVHTSRAILAYVKRIEGLFITVANFLYVYYFWSFVCCILWLLSILFYAMPSDDDDAPCSYRNSLLWSWILIQPRWQLLLFVACSRLKTAAAAPAFSLSCRKNHSAKGPSNWDIQHPRLIGAKLKSFGTH